jgi:hypothetical protein
LSDFEPLLSTPCSNMLGVVTDNRLWNFMSIAVTILIGNSTSMLSETVSMGDRC